MLQASEFIAVIQYLQKYFRFNNRIQALIFFQGFCKLQLLVFFNIFESFSTFLEIAFELCNRSPNLSSYLYTSIQPFLCSCLSPTGGLRLNCIPSRGHTQQPPESCTGTGEQAARPPAGPAGVRLPQVPGVVQPR